MTDLGRQYNCSLIWDTTWTIYIQHIKHSIVYLCHQVIQNIHPSKAAIPYMKEQHYKDAFVTETLKCVDQVLITLLIMTDKLEIHFCIPVSCIMAVNPEHHFL